MDLCSSCDNTTCISLLMHVVLSKAVTNSGRNWQRDWYQLADASPVSSCFTWVGCLIQLYGVRSVTLSWANPLTWVIKWMHASSSLLSEYWLPREVHQFWKKKRNTLSLSRGLVCCEGVGVMAFCLVVWSHASIGVGEGRIDLYLAGWFGGNDTIRELLRSIACSWGRSLTYLL